MRLKKMRLKLLKYDYLNFRSGLLSSTLPFNCLNGFIKKEACVQKKVCIYVNARKMGL